MTDPDSVRVLAVEGIRAHPHAERLTLVSLRDHDRELVANLTDEGSFRYVPGQLLALYPVGAILPRDLLEEMEAWDAAKGKGTLAGNKGNRVGARKFVALDGNPAPEARYESRGALRPIRETRERDGATVHVLRNGRGEEMEVEHGTDVTAFLGIEMHRHAA